VLGTGRIARMFHLRALRAAGADVRLLADPDPDALAAAEAQAPAAATTRDWADAVGRDDLDAVVVTLPSRLHAPAAVAAFAHGKHVYVEKPLALDAAEAGAVVTAWRDAGTIGAVGLNFRFQPLVLDARRRVAAGQLGRIVAVRGTVCSPPRPLPGWKRSRATGGGALLDLAVHHLDLLPFVLDDPVATVAAHLHSVRTTDDTALVTAVTAGGVGLQLVASASSRQTDRVEILGDRATLTFDRFSGGRVEVRPVDGASDRRDRAEAGLAELAHAARRVARTVAPADEPSFRAAIGAFLRACDTGVQHRPSIADGAAVAVIVDAAERSAARGGPPVAVAGSG
jgi:predicted dehydrogenase